MKRTRIMKSLKVLAIYFLVGWFAGDVIQLCRGKGPLTRKGVQLLCITQTRQHAPDSLGTPGKETILVGFRITFMH